MKRELRSVEILHETADNEYSLAQGPLTLDREKRVANADEASARFDFRYESLKSISVLILFVYKLIIGSSKINRENYPRKCF